ncbi:MAG: hypothetical protein Q9187_000854 [Circinaria calcarea]
MVHWNDQADAKLFACVLKTHGVKLDMPRLAAAMTEALGEEVTAKALTHRFAKLRSVASSADSSTPKSSPTKPSTTGTNGSASAKSTPRKRKAAAPKNASASVGAQYDADGDEDDDDEEYGPVKVEKGTGRKRGTRGGAAAAKKVKSQSQGFEQGYGETDEGGEDKKMGIKVEVEGDGYEEGEGEEFDEEG